MNGRLTDEDDDLLIAALHQHQVHGDDDTVRAAVESILAAHLDAQEQAGRIDEVAAASVWARAPWSRSPRRWTSTTPT